MSFSLRIKTDNDAFQDGDGGKIEIARILRDIIEDLEAGREGEAVVRDINGNRVGEWKLR